MTIKTRSCTHRPRVSLARFSFCWWRHNWFLMTSQWPYNCVAITWMLISNSLDIAFIHWDIHSRSCKKLWEILLCPACWCTDSKAVPAIYQTRCWLYNSLSILWGLIILQSVTASYYIEGLVQERCNSSALALELYLSYTLGREYRVMR